MAILSIGGRDFSNTISYEVTYQDIDSNDSTRNEAGVMFRDRLRANVAKISLEFKFLSLEDGAALLKAVTPAQFEVTYLSPLLGAQTTGTFYAGDKTMKLQGDSKNLQYWSSVKFNLVEF